MTDYIALGIMSGTSLDGLDLALCRFWQESDKTKNWDFEILSAITVAYPKDLTAQLRNAQNGSALELITLHKHYGKFIAQKVNDFLVGKPRPLFIASHGHTIFHYPEQGINFQLGDGAVVAALTGLAVVCDFRSQDIALAGQGAPLVPVGDIYLFGEYDLLLNLGGFSNITVRSEMIAFDISPVNYALNFFARQLGLEFDRDGQLGKQGKVNNRLLAALDSIDYYSLKPPKSLSDHWFYKKFLPIIQAYQINAIDKLATLYHHISAQIAAVLNHYQGRTLVTGGGAKNKFLIELIQRQVNNEIIIPPMELVDYKEAVVFAFLGLLRWLGIENVYASFTGAVRNTISGSVYLP